MDDVKPESLPSGYRYTIKSRGHSSPKCACLGLYFFILLILLVRVVWLYGISYIYQVTKYLRELINPLNTKRRLFSLKTHFVPHSKHFSSRL